jgi:HAD superfamily hydrolase (TIGR01509 family)
MVCFDIGGVLVRIHHWLFEAATAAGVHLGPKALGIRLGNPVVDAHQAGDIDEDHYLAQLGQLLGCSPEDARRIHEAVIVAPYEGTLELVKDIHAGGVRTGCLSNTNALHWNVLMDEARFPAISAMDVRLASHEAKLHKPDPAIFLRFCELASVPPEETVFFDDSAKNVAAAQALGFHVLQIDPEGDPVAQMRAHLQTLGVAIR